MTRRTKLWRVGAALFALINVAGAGYAVAVGEGMHAAAHAVLLVLGIGAYLVWKAVSTWATRSSGQQLSPASTRPSPGADPTPKLPDQRIDYLQRSVDAIALEVERIGETQRFNERLRAEQEQNPPTKKNQ
jgi:hypothetical protein